MNIRIRAMESEEQKYAYSQSQQLAMQCGSIGHLRGDFGKTGDSFYTMWENHNTPYKTDEFKKEFDEVINALRFDEQYEGLMKNRSAMSQYCYEWEDSIFQGNYCAEYGFRIDTEEYAYLIRCNLNENVYNFYIYPYVSQWLDQHLEKASQGIRFIDSGYKELFHIEDGGQIAISYPNGEKSNRSCRYIDKTHVQVGRQLYHICQFAEIMERNSATYIPVARPERYDSNDKQIDSDRENYGR